MHGHHLHVYTHVHVLVETIHVYIILTPSHIDLSTLQSAFAHGNTEYDTLFLPSYIYTLGVIHRRDYYMKKCIILLIT